MDTRSADIAVLEEPDTLYYCLTYIKPKRYVIKL